MMFKRIVTILVIAVFAISLAGCWGRAVENTNTDNANAAADADAQFANITDANEALAEGNRLLDEDQTELAVAALKQAVKLDPDLAEAWFKLGIGYALLEEAAQQSGDRVIGESDSKAKPNSQKAFEKAVEAYKKWLDANDKDDVAWFNLGRAYFKLAKDEEAEKAFQRAVKLKPNDVEYLIELGRVQIRLAKYHEAVEALKKALEIDPDNPRAQDMLDDAEAGRQRLDYVAPNNTNTSRSSNSNTNTNASGNANSGPSNSTTRPLSNTVRRPESNTIKNPPANRPPR